MFDGMKEKQEQMEAALKNIKLEREMEGGAIKIQANAGNEIENINIDMSKINDSDELEDLLLVAMNRIMEDMKAKQAEETQKMMSSMIPGLGGLGNLFS